MSADDPDYLDGWLRRRINRQVEQALPALVEAELQRRAVAAAAAIAEGVCICRTCGTVLRAHQEGARKRKVTVAEIVEMVAKDFDIAPKLLLGRGRQNGIAQRRQIIVWLSVVAAGTPRPVVGKVFGFDHSTVAHAINAVERRMLHDNDLAAYIRQRRRDIENMTDSLVALESAAE